jgi:hypothetical protein
MIKFIKCTAAQYAALESKNEDAFYYVDGSKLYLGSKELTTEFDVISAVSLVNDSTKGNEALYSELQTLTGDGDNSISKMISSAITTAKSEVVNSVEAGDKSIDVSGTTTSKTIKANISKEANNNLELKEDGLYVNVPAGTDYTVTVTESTPEGYAKAYTIAQQATGLSTTINIPKDMVVESGSVEVNPEGQAEGTYLVLTLANTNNDKVYINVSDLIEYVTAGEDTATIHVAIDADHKVTANVINGSIGSDQLADAIKTSLNKADSALQSSDIKTGTENGTISVAGTDVEVKGLDTAAYAKTTDFDAAGSASTAETNAKNYADGLASNYDAAGSADTALTSAKSYADGLASNYDEAGAAATAEQNAKDYADTQVANALAWETME